jgi:membrane protein
MAEEQKPGEKGGARGVIGFARQVLKDFSQDNCPSLAASIAYYTAFALPPLLVFIIMLLGLLVDPQDVQGMIGRQMRSMLGEQGAIQVQTMIENANKVEAAGSTTAFLIGLAALIFSASGAFLSLQGALNTAWEVKPDPRRGGVRNFVFKRLLSLGLIAAIAFLLLVSLVISGLLSALGGFLQTLLPGGVSSFLLIAANWLLSLGVITLLFAAIFKILPDAVIGWRDVWAGALFTTLLFVIGKELIGLYLGRSNPGSVFGAAGSFALILIWIYYSALIVLLGAEFTQVWIRYHGKTVRPESGAVRLRMEPVRDEGSSPPEAAGARGGAPP